MAVGSDVLAGRMRRQMSVNARLKELHKLLRDISPLKALPLDVYFVDRGHLDSYRDASGGRGGGTTVIAG